MNNSLLSAAVIAGLLSGVSLVKAEDAKHDDQAPVKVEKSKKHEKHKKDANQCGGKNGCSGKKTDESKKTNE